MSAKCKGRRREDVRFTGDETRRRSGRRARSAPALRPCGQSDFQTEGDGAFGEMVGGVRLERQQGARRRSCAKAIVRRITA